MNTIPSFPVKISTSLYKYLQPTSRRTNTLSATVRATQPPTTTLCHLDCATTVAIHITSCMNILQLRQIQARLIRTRFQDFYTAPFYWNSIIRSYTRLDSPKKAIQVFIEMMRDGVAGDEYTMPIMLKAVSHLSNYILAKQLHGHVLKLGLSANMYCESGLISLYAKACEFKNARKVFGENSERMLGSWNAMISGMAQGGRAKEAVEIFMELKKAGFRPDDVTMVSATSACGNLGDLSLGLQLHKCVVQVRVAEKCDMLMMNSLIDMYGKCGRMDLAHRVFSGMGKRNVSSWTSMIVGYALHGHAKEALESFRCMSREAGVRPNHVTFVGVLSACVHGGNVEEGKHYFRMMKNEYKIMPMLQHYGCMVDLLGRVGLLEEAREMIKEMPMKANVVVWGCLMGACEKHRNVKMGEWAAKHLQELEPWSDGVYVVLSNIYASSGHWDDVERMRDILKERKLCKVPAYSLPTSLD